MKQPNIVIIIADDVAYNDLSLYGGVNVQTPGIDALAADGMVFNNAYLSMAMCCPCRTELYTGLYPMRSGSCWNHSAVLPGTQSIPHHLRALGYRVGLAGKWHIAPKTSFPFDDVPGLTENCCAKVTEFDAAGMRAFMQQDADQPFCLVVALVEAHGPWTMGDPSHFDRQKLQLPPYMADTPVTRDEYAKYLAEVEVLDERVRGTLQAIEESGCTDNTLVMFTSEQGSQFPGNKWTNWNTGVHTAFTVRWPGQVQPGTRTDALVQYADVLPTLIAAAGGDPAAAPLDGSSFLPVLQGGTDRHRDYAYCMHNNIPEGPPYPIRAVTDGTWHYIRNLTPEAVYIEKHIMGMPEWNNYWSSWLVHATDDENTARLVNRYMHRPPEQLYQSREDPCEMNDRANDPACADIKQRLSDELDAWMTAQGDPGIALDTQAEWQAARARWNT